MNGTAAVIPASAAAEASRCASAGVVASGFSQITCLPARIAISASAACVTFGVQMWTASTSSAAISSSADAAACSACSRSAELAARSGVTSATRLTTPPAARTAWA